MQLVMTKQRAKTSISAVVLATMLSACAATSDKYPSLAIRDFEAADPAQAGTASDPATALSPARIAQVEKALGVALEQSAAFNAKLQVVRPQVAAARGLGPSSNAWADAQIAYADLISHRSQTAIALADIDLILAEAASELVNVERLTAQQAEVAAKLADQDRALAQLRDQL